MPSTDVGLSDNKENVTSAERSEESDYNSSDEDNDERMERIIAVAASQGIPIEWILRHALEADDGNDDDDNEPLVYPFESPPKSLEDVANFIISDKCKSIGKWYSCYSYPIIKLSYLVSTLNEHSRFGGGWHECGFRDTRYVQEKSL